MLQILTVVLVAIAIAIAPQAAQAADFNAPPGNSGVDQYFEAVPSSGGPKRPGETTSAGKALPKKVQQSLADQGSDGEAVLRLVQSTAPAGAVKAAAGNGSSSSKGSGSKDSSSTASGNEAAPSGSALASTANAFKVGGEGGGMGVLLPILLVITAVAASAYMIVRRRSGER